MQKTENRRKRKEYTNQERNLWNKCVFKPDFMPETLILYKGKGVKNFFSFETEMRSSQAE